MGLSTVPHLLHSTGELSSVCAPDLIRTLGVTTLAHRFRYAAGRAAWHYHVWGKLLLLLCTWQFRAHTRFAAEVVTCPHRVPHHFVATVAVNLPIRPGE